MWEEHVAFVQETIARSAWSMEKLLQVRSLGLNDWAIGAGFVRTAVWDRLHGYEAATPLPDVDVLYFSGADLSVDADMAVEDALLVIDEQCPWSVHNQARMHVRNQDRPYHSTLDAISFWLETPTGVAVRLEDDGSLAVMAPFGLGDLIGMRAAPTRAARLRRAEAYTQRMMQKNWPATWPLVTVEWPDVQTRPTALNSVREFYRFF
jgi:hypothetical protein